jgi:signal transduction histidine kinase
MKQDFVAMVSHDLRTPLTSLMMTHALMERGRYGEINDAALRGLRSCKESIKRLINLVNDLLDLDKIESGQLKLYLEIVPLYELVNNSADAVEALLSEKELHLEVDVDQSLQAYTDRERSIQTLVNLLSNAIKFSQAGSTIQVKAKKRGEDVLIGVIDQGRGIPSDRLHTVFERFRQIKMEDGARGTGTGLGLAICKSIVELNRGKIGVDSVEGTGSTFWFSLPASLEQYERLGMAVRSD